MTSNAPAGAGPYSTAALTRSTDSSSTCSSSAATPNPQSKIALNQLLAQLVETAQAETERKNAAITLRTDDRIQNVPLDPDLIAEALLNLILNAVEAVEPRQGRIEVTTQLDEPNRRVLITCRDNGCGIADTHIIFEPFHTAGKKTGTGLGLPIAKKIIEQHKGTIAVQSRPGQGAIFTVTLPTTSTPSAAEETS